MKLKYGFNIHTNSEQKRRDSFDKYFIIANKNQTVLEISLNYTLTLNIKQYKSLKIIKYKLNIFFQLFFDGNIST